jgi:hypothetical protein
MIGFVINKVLFNKVANKVSYEILTTIIVTITETIFSRYRKKNEMLMYNLSSKSRRFVLR